MKTAHHRPPLAGFLLGSKAGLRRLLAVGGLILLAGCKSSSTGPAVATLGSEVVTLSDFKSRLHDAPAAYQQYVSTPAGQRQFLNLLLREKTLLIEARKAGLQKEPNYKKAVDEFGKKAKRDLRDYKESLLIEMYLARLRAKDLPVTDADVRRYYDAHLSEFTHPMEIQASHILLISSPEAEQVLARLRNGESFEALARSVSMDSTTASKDGKLAPFTKGTLMPEFESAVSRLKNGQVSGAVKSPFGYHIIKKISERALPPRPFEATLRGPNGRVETVREMIRAKLQREKFDQWIAKTQASLGVKIDEKALAAVSRSPTPAAPPLRQESVQ